MNDVIKKIKEKKEFSQIPDDIILRVLNLNKVKNLDERSQIKEARSLLRKIFSAFLTNKVLSGKLNASEILKKHYSSKYRDYETVYKRILDNEKTIVDLGAGVNGFSYPEILKFSKAKYIGIEAIGQLVDLMNNYFIQNNVDALAIHEDLFNADNIVKILKSSKKPRVVFMFSIIDALEFLERDYSKQLILQIISETEKIALSFPTESLGKRRRFKAKRFWILNFIEENFKVLDDFELNGERFLIFSECK
ncbi:MAG: hypothetical protein ACOYT4_01780 [Nanoarchaeota archaeon]